MNSTGREISTRQDVDIEVIEEGKIDEPVKFHVFVLNDDVTPADAVVGILIVAFRLSPKKALKIMTEAHNTGQAKVGTYYYSIAVTRIEKAREVSRRVGVNLGFKLEEA